MRSFFFSNMKNYREAVVILIVQVKAKVVPFLLSTNHGKSHCDGIAGTCGNKQLACSQSQPSET